MPDSLQDSPLAKALLDLVNATSERHYSKIYARAESLFNLAAQTDFPDAKLGSLIANLVTSFVGGLLEYGVCFLIPILCRGFPGTYLSLNIKGVQFFASVIGTSLPGNPWRSDCWGFVYTLIELPFD